jgi:hypothetical protein
VYTHSAHRYVHLAGRVYNDIGRLGYHCPAPPRAGNPLSRRNRIVAAGSGMFGVFNPIILSLLAGLLPK